MKKMSSIVLFSLFVILVAASGSFAQSPGVCASPYVWNATAGKCQVAPTCATGSTYNATTNRCEQAATPVYSCPSGGSASTLSACNASCFQNGTCTQGQTSTTSYCYNNSVSVVTSVGCKQNPSGTTVTCPSPLPVCTTISGWTDTSTYYMYVHSGFCTYGVCIGEIYSYTNTTSYWTCSYTGSTQYSSSSACTTACHQSQTCTGPTYSCSSGWSLTGTTCYQAATCTGSGTLNTTSDKCETANVPGTSYEYDKIGRVTKIIRD